MLLPRLSLNFLDLQIFILNKFYSKYIISIYIITITKGFK